MVWQVYAILAAALLFAVTGIAAAVHAAQRFLRRRGKGLDDDEPKCGRCGYIIRAGSSRVCPECGSDLAAVGVLTSSTAPPAFPFLPLWLLAVAAVVAACYAGPALVARTPWGWHFYAWRLLYTTQLNQAGGVTDGSFHLDVRGVGRWWSHRLTRLRVDYKIPSKNDGWLRLEVGPDGKSGRLLGHESLVGPPRPAPLDRQLFARLVRAAGFDPDAGEGATLTAAIEQRTHEILREDWSPVASGNRGPGGVLNGVMYSPSENAGVVGGLVVWLGAVVPATLLLVRRHRRRRARAAAASRGLLQSLALSA